MGILIISQNDILSTGTKRHYFNLEVFSEACGMHVVVMLPNCTGYKVYVCVRNLPQVVMQKCNSQESNL